MKTKQIAGLLLFAALLPALLPEPVSGETWQRRGSLKEVLPLIEQAVTATDTALLAAPMLGRPTDKSVTINVVTSQPLIVYAEYGMTPGRYEFATEMADTRDRAEGETGEMAALELPIDGLDPGTRYYYRLMCRSAGEAEFHEAASGCFHTRRSRGSRFTFAIQADSHLNEVLKSRSLDKCSLYSRTLANVLSDEPDFLIDMGDFAGIEWYTGGKVTSLDQALDRYLLQRLFLGRISPWVPFYLVLGNHEGEQGWRRESQGDNLEVLGALARKALIPNPHPDGFYSGSTEETECCGLRENYYAWEWGDALFVVIDPFWNTMRMPHLTGGFYEPSLDAWDWTLGKDQYDWLYETLHNSSARWKFVFSHHITGGSRYSKGKFNPYGRGGITAAKYKVAQQPSFEWGGEDDSGDYVFDRKRPGWEHGPIHDMMAAEGVDIFFHGHDHAFVYESLDGVVYQLCPQPANVLYGDGFYRDDLYRGTMVNNSGHLRVRVSPDSVRVDYVRAVLPADQPLQEDDRRVSNGDVSYSYTLRKP